jgi:UDP-glucose 4-epimerase
MAFLDDIPKAVVTGGAGFIGSHLVDRLLKNGTTNVVLLDNLSSGTLDNLKKENLESSRFTFLKADCKEPNVATLEAIKGSDIIFHLAGNPEVRIGSKDSSVDYNENILATFRMLNAARSCGVPNFAFTSTSTVYGEAREIPTPEDYSPMVPISTYGGSKLACEAMISAFSHMYSISSTVFRFANVIGTSSRHGVIYDFVQKLRRDPTKLEILGDGTQRKSYIDVEDCVDALLFALSKRESTNPFDVYNLGSKDTIDVLEIARIVSSEMGLAPELVTTGGVDGGRGWKGDVKVMQLDISKIMKLGWVPRFDSAESVRRAVHSQLDGNSSIVGLANVSPLASRRK